VIIIQRKCFNRTKEFLEVLMPHKLILRGKMYGSAQENSMANILSYRKSFIHTK
jgi:hypothetical protein